MIIIRIYWSIYQAVIGKKSYLTLDIYEDICVYVKRKSVGPRTVPRGTPELTVIGEEYSAHQLPLIWICSGELIQFMLTGCL